MKDFTDTIPLPETGEHLELEKFKDSIQQLHGQGMVKKAFYIHDDICIEDINGRIYKNVIIFG